MKYLILFLLISFLYPNKSIPAPPLAVVSTAIAVIKSATDAIDEFSEEDVEKEEKEEKEETVKEVKNAIKKEDDSGLENSPDDGFVRMHLTSEENPSKEWTNQSHHFNELKEITPPAIIESYEGEFDHKQSILFCKIKGREETTSCYYKQGSEKNKMNLDFCVGPFSLTRYRTVRCTSIEFKMKSKGDKPAKAKFKLRYSNDRFGGWE